MIWRHDGTHFVGVEQAPFHFRCGIHIDKAKIDGAVFDPLRNGGIFALLEDKTHTRMAALEGDHPAWQECAADAGEGADADDAALKPLHFALTTREGIFGVGDGLDVRKDRFTISGEMNAFLAAGEQSEAEFLLKIFDGLTDGALRILDGIGGFCKSAVLDDFAKDVVFG